MKRLKIRLQAVWSVLTTDFILISDIRRKVGYTLDQEEEAYTSWKTYYRTGNPDTHDFLVVKGEVMRKYSKLPEEVKGEYQL